MRRKVIALFITVLISVASILPANAASAGGINTFLEKLLSIEAAERDSYITLLVPMFMVDSGIEDLQGYVRDYQPGNQNSYMNTFIGKMLQYTDKATLINSLETIKCTNLQARRNFLEALKNKTPMTISAKTETAVNTLLADTYEDLPELKTLFEEGGYDTEVLAKLINCIVEINGSKALYVYDGSKFSEGTINAALESSVNNVWADYVITENGLEKAEDGVTGVAFDLSELLAASADKLNARIPSNQRAELASALSEIGVVKLTGGESTTPSGSSRPSGDTPNNPTTAPSEEPVDDETVEITVEEGQTKTVSLETNIKRPVLYKKDGENLVLIKYSALYEGKLIAKVSETGTYVIKEAPEKFGDSDGWAKDYIEMLAARDIISGKATGVYAPNDTITREEFVKLIVELLDIEVSQAETIFADVNPDAWYAGYVAAAYESKVINGMSATQFGVGAPIRRQDMAKIINTVLEQKGIKGEPADGSVFVDFNAIADYAKEHVLSIYSMGIISGDPNRNFNPESYATRAEAAKMVYGMLVQIINN